MAKKTCRSRFWTILGTVNVLAMAYPISMLLGADTQEANLVAVIALCGAGLLLAVGDLISILLAYSASY